MEPWIRVLLVLYEGRDAGPSTEAKAFRSREDEDEAK